MCVLQVQMAQPAKNPPAGAGDVGDPGLIPEDPLEEGRAAHSSIPA